MTVQVLLFGQARELAGVDHVILECDPGATVADVLAGLMGRYPPLCTLQRVLLTAVNEVYCDRSRAVTDGDEVAVFPPVSGGSEPADFVELTRQPIDIASMRARLLRGDDGAVCIFDGVARNNTRGRATLYLEYEGYESMALRTLQQVVDEAHERWPAIDLIGITHRLGRIDITESSVVIVVTSPHRKAAFEACQYAIDRLKRIVPIWKKEYFVDGAVWVQGEAWPEEPGPA